MPFSSFATPLLASAGLLVWQSSSIAGVPLPLTEVAEVLDQTPFAPPLLQLEFHPTATGERVGNKYPGLAGTPAGPYECYARVPAPENKPGSYPLRVIIKTKIIFRDAQGKEVTKGKSAAGKTERATQILLSPNPNLKPVPGDANAPPVLLQSLIGSYENKIPATECFFLGDKALRIGVSDKVVEELLGTAVIERSKPKLMEATGETMETWTIKALDLELNFSVKPEGGRELQNLRAGPEAKVETARGIRPGLPESRVTMAYQNEISQPDSTPGVMQVIGNLYMGLFIDIKDGKVNSLYLGQGAE